MEASLVDLAMERDWQGYRDIASKDMQATNLYNLDSSPQLRSGPLRQAWAGLRI